VTAGKVPTSAQKLFWNSEIQFVCAVFWKEAPRPEMAVPWHLSVVKSACDAGAIAANTASAPANASMSHVQDLNRGLDSGLGPRVDVTCSGMQEPP
jgi:hypothetical protein